MADLTVIQRTLQGLQHFWDFYGGTDYKHPKLHALPWADTELGEAESRWLRYAFPGYSQNSDKPRNLESVYMELGDAGYMLGTYLLYVGVKPDRLPQTNLPHRELSETWWHENARMMGLARDTQQDGKKALASGLVFNLILRLAGVVGFDLYHWVIEYTLPKVIEKNNLIAKRAALRPAIIPALSVIKWLPQEPIMTARVSGEVLIESLWVYPVLCAVLTDYADTIRISEPCFVRQNFGITFTDSVGDVLVSFSQAKTELLRSEHGQES